MSRRRGIDVGGKPQEVRVCWNGVWMRRSRLMPHTNDIAVSSGQLAMRPCVLALNAWRMGSQ
eukprot:5654953-Prorocentrum_lima.AAC.1